jgi:hypothetical protein
MRIHFVSHAPCPLWKVAISLVFFICLISIFVGMYDFFLSTGLITCIPIYYYIQGTVVGIGVAVQSRSNISVNVSCVDTPDGMDGH